MKPTDRKNYYFDSGTKNCYTKKSRLCFKIGAQQSVIDFRKATRLLPTLTRELNVRRGNVFDFF